MRLTVPALLVLGAAGFLEASVEAEVPRGKTFEITIDRSKIFPGTTRTLKVYVPAQYRGDKPACVYVGLDGLGFNAPAVFDTLIAAGEMPVTIAIGIPSGSVSSATDKDNRRYNRSYEFDGLDGNLPRFLLEEIFPEVERHKTPDGDRILLSKDPNDRAAGGLSTGGIGAFTLAWERPDAFRRVFTAIATFVGMRGGDRYPVLIRKTEPKPIRIFMQDGSNDQYLGSPEVGDWWMGNQTVERALTFAGYQVNHVWGDGGHDGRQATAIFPDAMRWLWKDWPAPVTAGQSQNTFLKAALVPGESWQLVPGNYRADGIAADSRGRVVIRDWAARSAWRIDAGGNLSEPSLKGAPPGVMVWSAEERWYLADPRSSTIIVRNEDGTQSKTIAGIAAHQLVVTHQGNLYGAEPSTGKVWLIRPSGERTVLDSGLSHPTAIALSPDGQWLAVAEGRTHFGYSYRVQPNGTVDAKQRYYWFHVPDDADDSDVRAWVMDQYGHLFAATRMGVQIFDRNGRVRAILPVPGGAVTGITFGGASFDTLYVTTADRKVYRRKLKVSGAPPWAAPMKVPDEGGA